MTISKVREQWYFKCSRGGNIGPYRSRVAAHLSMMRLGETNRPFTWKDYALCAPYYGAAVLDAHAKLLRSAYAKLKFVVGVLREGVNLVVVRSVRERDQLVDEVGEPRGFLREQDAA